VIDLEVVLLAGAGGLAVAVLVGVLRSRPAPEADRWKRLELHLDESSRAMMSLRKDQVDLSREVLAAITSATQNMVTRSEWRPFRKSMDDLDTWRDWVEEELASSRVLRERLARDTNVGEAEDTGT